MEVPAALSSYAHPGHGITPAEHHLALPGFWPAYLSTSRRDIEEFGADLADVDAACEALYDAPRTWPAYRLPLPYGRTVWIVLANFPDDPGVDYLLTDPAHPTPRPLASTEGPFSGPALSWPDLLALAEAVPDAVPDAVPEAVPGAVPGSTSGAASEAAPIPEATSGDDGGDGDDGGVRAPDHRLLLLLPAHSDTDAPTQAALDRVTAALRAVGVPRVSAPALAERFLDTGTSWDASSTTPLSGAGTP